ncbi:fibroblast growth factor receptor 3-like, partial [Saccostrea cucullata]|uniref:fibroblast growth factor receptor 3-like n=1 Tax=Saccostrea cuccullata TaxID=36930 RepID=UPI002ED39B67
MWIQTCTLYVNWTAENEVSGCALDTYHLKLFQNDTERRAVDTTSLMYSNDAIFSNFVYRVEVTTEMTCNGNQSDQGTRIKSISTFPEIQTKNITKRVSENTVLECPFTGAYQPLRFEWQHRIGTDETLVRNVTTSQVSLRNVSYRDMGMYDCTVHYKLCGKSNESMTSQSSMSSIVFHVKGPPFIDTSIKNLSIKPGENITVPLQILSFPAPYEQVTIKSQDNNYVNHTVNFTNTVVPLKAYGKTIDVEGYVTSLTMLNVSEMWFGTNTITVSNSLGHHSISFKIQRPDAENHIYNFIVRVLKENMYLLAGIGGGILVLFIIVIVLVVTCKKKKGKNLSLNDNTYENKQSEISKGGERLYSRPFSLFSKKKDQ